MNMQESRNGLNKNGVKFFSYEQLSKPAADESWDRVKVVCSQPFNIHAQYGLSFIKFHSKSDADKVSINKNISFGKFNLKSDNEDTNISIGSLFAKRKDPQLPLTAASSIRAASLNSANNSTVKLVLNNTNSRKEMISTNDENKNPKKKKIDVEDVSMNNRKATSGTLLYTKDDKLDSPKSQKDVSEITKTKKINLNGSNNLAHSTNIQTDFNNKSTTKKIVRSTSSGSLNSNSKTKIEVKKPIIQNGPKRTAFNKLLENVAFVMSGYQNPYRAELRSKAIEMGAKYKGDWDRTCTHLVCAFLNTPKYNQVRGEGRIVRKDWIDDCYAQRKKLPWKQYALNKNDVNDSDSDEEIWEEIQDEQMATEEKEELNEEVSDSDTDDEIERVRLHQIQSTKSLSVYDVETDIDDDDDEDEINAERNEKNAINNCIVKNDASPVPGSSKHSIHIPTFFSNITFFVDSDMPEKTKKKLWRYIVSHKGQMTNKMDEANYIVSERQSLQKQNGKCRIVKPEWIWNCHDASDILPI